MASHEDIRGLAEKVFNRLALSPPVGEGRQPVLLILTGLPGSGKTYLARALCERVPFTLVGSDPLRAALFEQMSYTPEENRLVYAVADALLWRLLRERRDVIYDAVNLSERRRADLRRLALDAGARPITVLLRAPEHVIWLRLAARREQPVPRGESEADWEVYCKLAPRAERVEHQHVVVDTTQDITPALEEIIRLVRGQGVGQQNTAPVP
jgi:predicted kinase